VGLDKITNVIDLISPYNVPGMTALNGFKIVVKSDITEDGFRLTGPKEISVNANWLSNSSEDVVAEKMEDFVIDYYGSLANR
jgi:hypothetical protein